MLPRLREDPLPPFVSAAEVVRRTAAALRPPRRILISEAAEKHRYIKNKDGGYNGPWLNSMTPHLVEPMDRQLRRDTRLVVLVGPSQFGKSEIFLNTVSYLALYRAADALIVQPTFLLANDFAERRVENGLLKVSKDVAAQLGPDRGDNKLLSKTFKNGSMITIVWPTPSQMASRPVPIGMADEYDSIPDDIGDEGSAASLLDARTTQYGRNGCVLVASSPKRETYTGIIPLYDQGDRNLWWWQCPYTDCGEYWTPGFDDDGKPTLAHLHIRKGATPEEASAKAALICPCCGQLVTDDQRGRMNAGALWLPRGMRILPDGTILGARPATRIGSYWFAGEANPFRSLADLIHDYVVAERHFEATGDEQLLKTWWQTKKGAPYPSLAKGAAPIEAAELERRAEEYPLKVVPAGAAFVLSTVDVQGTRFCYAVWAFGRGGEIWTVDYADIFKAVDADGSERQIDPAGSSEDWDLLCDEVVTRAYPVEGDPGAVMRPHLTTIDTGGADGVTGHAYEFWIRARERLDPDGMPLSRRIMLTKGGRLKAAPLVTRTLIETDSRGRRLKKGVKLFTLNVHALKDMASTRLRRTQPGALFVHMSKHLPKRFFAEITAEAKGADGWEKLRPRNEAWDLLVMALGAFVRLGGLKFNWSSPPSWARGVVVAAQPEPAAPANDDAAAAPSAPPAPSGAAEPKPRRRKRRGFLGDITSWGA